MKKQLKVSEKPGACVANNKLRQDHVSRLFVPQPHFASLVLDATLKRDIFYFSRFRFSTARIRTVNEETSAACGELTNRSQ